MTKRKTKQEIDEIIKLYQSQEYNAVEIGKMYNISNSGVLKLVKKHGYYNPIPQTILQRKYDIDENFFEKITNESQAYFLGLLYADGYNSIEKRCVRLTLHQNDVDILEKFLVNIRYTNTIKISNKIYRTINIYNMKICNDLSKLGCVQAKSLILKFPTKNQVPEKLIFHFLRGMWDGDGSIKKYKSLDINLVSTYNFCNSLQLLLRKYGIDSNIYNRHPNGITSTIRIRGGKSGVKKFLALLYKDSTVYLDRKYKSAQEILNS